MSSLTLDGSTRIVATEFVKLEITGTSNLATESYVNTAIINGGGLGCGLGLGFDCGFMGVFSIFPRQFFSCLYLYERSNIDFEHLEHVTVLSLYLSVFVSVSSFGSSLGCSTT